MMCTCVYDVCVEQLKGAGVRVTRVALTKIALSRQVTIHPFANRTIDTEVSIVPVIIVNQTIVSLSITADEGGKKMSVCKYYVLN